MGKKWRRTVFWAPQSFLEGSMPRDTLGSNTLGGCVIVSVCFIFRGAVYPVCKTLASFPLTIMPEAMGETTH